MSEFRQHAAKLAKIGDLFADELSLKAHTTGISANLRKALSDWDLAAIEFRQAEREAR